MTVPKTNVKRKRLTVRHKQILWSAIKDFVVRKEKAANACAGSMWPGIYQGEADDARQLYEDLTGEPLDK
jgi:hypothetical protein